jgi:hypothetical protein
MKLYNVSFVADYFVLTTTTDDTEIDPAVEAEEREEAIAKHASDFILDTYGIDLNSLANDYDVEELA